MVKKSRKKYSMYDATEHHEKRSNRSKGVDESKTSKIVKTKPTKEWYKNPSKSDILYIDTKKAKAKDVKEVIRHLKAIKPVQDKDVKYASVKRAIVTYTKGSDNVLRKAINVRYNNVRVFKRRKKGRNNDYWISVLKK